MRVLLLVLLALAGTLPLLAQANSHLAPHEHIRVMSSRGDKTLLIISAAEGLRRLQSGRWIVPRGLPGQSSFYGIVAAGSHIYISNGDVFSSSDQGRLWHRLPVPRTGLGSAGITYLATSDQDGTIFGAGAKVLAFKNNQWIPWGRGWPTYATPTLLLSLPDGSVLAAAGNLLLEVRNSSGMWRGVPLPRWPNAPITAMAVGPDGATPYVAVLGHGLWYLGQATHPLDTPELPNTTINALRADAQGGDLYVATDNGLFVGHQPSIDVSNIPLRWRRIGSHAVFVSLRPWSQGNGMLAVSRDGTLCSSTHVSKQQALDWQRCTQQIPLQGGSTVIAALVGTETNNAAALTRLPALFTRQCLPDGPTQDQAFDICGPFRTYYLTYGQSFVLGFPRGRAASTGRGTVIQSFGKVQIEWTPRRGAFLAPAGRLMAGRRMFVRPTQQEAQAAVAAGTVYLNGYYVDQRFYRFWRSYLNANGASIFGPPISQALREPSSDGSGQDVWVQYFANARMEYHPNSSSPTVQLSYLGR